MAEDAREQIRDELAGTQIGQGYYAMAVSVEEAAQMADALLARWPGIAAVISGEPSDEMADAEAERLRGGEPTEEEIEAGAREVWRYYVGSSLDGFDKHAYAYDREKSHDTARAVFRAAREARTT